MYRRFQLLAIFMKYIEFEMQNNKKRKASTQFFKNLNQSFFKLFI
jgi:hypothetical protein